MAETVGLLGFVNAFLQGNAEVAYPFLGSAIALFVFLIPRPNLLEEKLQKASPGFNQF